MKHKSLKPKVSQFEEKWSPEIAIYGFTQMPNLLLACQGHLGLKDGEVVTIMQLLTYWYYHDTRIFPSIETLAKFSHKGYSTMQKRLRILEEKGFIKRRQMLGTSNTYDIIPLIQKLYKHQLTCTSPPRKQGEYWNKVRNLPPSYLSSKEDEALRRLTFNNTKNNVRIF